jgi:alkylation response protein AidB-like acyl-CoA dehydrogenase
MYVCAIVRSIRLGIEESFKWSMQREVFGKLLIQQPVVRQKLAKMVAQTEAVHCWLEQLTYQMNRLSYDEQGTHLAGPLALLKLRSTRVLEYVSDEACQIFGGRAITRTGMGRLVENLRRTSKFPAILAGSEEIMADLGIRQALRKFPPEAHL